MTGTISGTPLVEQGPTLQDEEGTTVQLSPNVALGWSKTTGFAAYASHNDNKDDTGSSNPSIPIGSVVARARPYALAMNVDDHGYVCIGCMDEPTDWSTVVVCPGGCGGCYCSGACADRFAHDHDMQHECAAWRAVYGSGVKWCKSQKKSLPILAIVTQLILRTADEMGGGGDDRHQARTMAATTANTERLNKRVDPTWELPPADDDTALGRLLVQLSAAKPTYNGVRCLEGTADGLHSHCVALAQGVVAAYFQLRERITGSGSEPGGTLPRPSKAHVLRLVFAVLRNTFNMTAPSSFRDVATVMYLGVAFFNHSCAPNIGRLRFGRDCSFVALEDIRAGDPLCITYIELNECQSARRKSLRAAYGFDCACRRCRCGDASEDQYSWALALTCESCIDRGGERGIMIPHLAGEVKDIVLCLPTHEASLNKTRWLCGVCRYSIDELF